MGNTIIGSNFWRARAEDGAEGFTISGKRTEE